MWLRAYAVGRSRKLAASNFVSKEFPAKKGKGEQRGWSWRTLSRMGPAETCKAEGRYRGLRTQAPWDGVHRPELTET